jgi:hypothetical protein
MPGVCVASNQQLHGGSSTGRGMGEITFRHSGASACLSETASGRETDAGSEVRYTTVPFLRNMRIVLASNHGIPQ